MLVTIVTKKDIGHKIVGILEVVNIDATKLMTMELIHAELKSVQMKMV